MTKKQIEEIAKQKMPDLNCDTVELAMAQIIGSARSMGLQVVEEAMVEGKRFKAAVATVDREKIYGLDEAVKIVKATATERQSLVLTRAGADATGAPRPHHPTGARPRNLICGQTCPSHTSSCDGP